MTAPNGFRIPRKKKVNAQEAAALATVAARQQAVGVTEQVRITTTFALRMSVTAMAFSVIAVVLAIVGLR